MKINLQENHVTGFKTSWHDDYLKWICAFANTEGGTLYIGIDDNGEICGTADAHKLSEDIPQKIRSTMGIICPVSILITDDGKDYIRVDVDSYSFPVSFRGKYYKRSGSTLQEVSGIELDRMLLTEQRRTWDSIPVTDVTVDDLSSDAFNIFRQNARDSGRIDSKALDIPNGTLLNNLHLIEGNCLNRAAVLAFHPDPEKWIIGAFIKIAYFRTDADIIYQDEVHGPLLAQVDKAIEIVYTKYLKALIHYKGIYRKETFFFPRESFRELLLNALIHRDYFSTQPVTIRITDDQIRIWNPGQLPKEITPENILTEHLSIQCNPLLANVFFKCGMIEAWGRGYQKILHFCELDKANAPVIDLSLGGVCARCYASDFYKKLEKGINPEEEQETGKPKASPTRPEKKDKTTQMIIDLIKDNPLITYDEIAQKIGKAKVTVKRYVQKLQNDGIVSREGGKKHGQWIILEEDFQN